MWTIEQALELIRLMQPEARKRSYHICLGGGVLNKGVSEKDLDLYFHPLCNQTDTKLAALEANKLNANTLKAWLDGLWGEGKLIGGTQMVRPNTQGGIIIEDIPDYPPDIIYYHRLKYDFSGARIDVFII